MVYSHPKQGQPDDLAEYRKFDERIDLEQLKKRDPTLYERTVAAGRLLPFDNSKIHLNAGSRSMTSK